MSNQQQIPNVGQLITGDTARDAIHVAVAPVTAPLLPSPLMPGEEVDAEGYPEQFSKLGSQMVGIVDPFLKVTVKSGERFWLFLYPGTVTSLRHVWTHPAFSPKVPERKQP